MIARSHLGLCECFEVMEVKRLGWLGSRDEDCLAIRIMAMMNTIVPVR